MGNERKTEVKMNFLELKGTAATALLMTMFSAAQLFPFPGKGSGTVDDPYQINTITGLDSVRNHLNKHFVMTADLDFNGSAYDSASSSMNEGWVAIGSDIFASFSGSFNGNNHVIRNMYISGNYGLFLYVANAATIRNVGIVDCHVKNSGGGTVAALAGDNRGLIDSCFATGVVMARGYGVGGLVGVNYYGTIRNSYSTCIVIGETDRIGGLVGQNVGGTIHSCHSTGNVFNHDTTWSSGKVGGLVGDNYLNGSISECYAACTVSANTREIGGLVGFNEGVIRACFFAGRVIGGCTVGSLAGKCGIDNSIKSTIINAYAVGSVEGCYGGVGGLLGTAVFNSISCCYAAVTMKPKRPCAITGTTLAGDVIGCYWDKETFGMDSSADGIGRTTAQMKQRETYSGWDFDTTWALDPAVNNGYPSFQWQRSGHGNGIRTPRSGSAAVGGIAVRRSGGSSRFTFTIRNPQRQRLQIRVVDIRGRGIRALIDRELPSGEYAYFFDAHGSAAMMYVYEAQLGTRRKTGLIGK